MSQCPEVCTRAVLGIMSLISPVIYGGDFRPYFTIYDPDFKHYQELHDHGTLGSVILGVTNPFFLKAYPNWTNLLYLSTTDKEEESGSTSSSSRSLHNLHRRVLKHESKITLKRALDPDELLL